LHARDQPDDFGLPDSGENRRRGNGAGFQQSEDQKVARKFLPGDFTDDPERILKLERKPNRFEELNEKVPD